VSVRNVDYLSLRKQLMAQNVPLPDAYPDIYKKGTHDPVTVNEPPMFGDSSAKVRRTGQDLNGIKPGSAGVSPNAIYFF
jgi:hypothetical protein